ncbi:MULTISPECIES: DUF488 family protein [unclassified Arthrobacter]|uniref:DUF488 domain-containing protein n=1 Tax=unclassified Arthrobacter TaxID=235627 RepID=UPI00159D54C6|nr:MULTISPECIES: DUF488 domain-containing protein [unclassified Arthrobacter]MCQ9166116.1 DUF488 domain-containing protein [Arthrobacter sp. STN4]NVN00600.1 DUF488 domain-containing protein [Arthrobacter sp. SDTb3-6]
MDALAIYTVGHSTHPFPEFLQLLAAHGIGRLVDVRTIPKSRHNPQFMQAALAVDLPAAGISYERAAGLGGLRHTHRDSPNGGWRNASFRGYADYMQTPEFVQALEGLIADARGGRTAIMCAEAVPWRCHRSLIGDALLVRGISVLDILDERPARPHRLTSFARVDGIMVSYPPETGPGARTGSGGP